MSVCDVPLCPNMSLGGGQQPMGAPRGVPRVHRPASETRNRLRIRLHRREANLHAQNKQIQKLAQCPANSAGEKQKGSVFKSVETQDDGTSTVHMLPTKQEHEQLANMLKSLDTCSHRHCNNYVPLKDSHVRKFEQKEPPSSMVSKLQKACLPFIHDKENKLVNEDEPTTVPAARGSEDIDKLIKFIEGKDYEIAQKKAAKKARQKQKKEDEKRKKEEEEEAKRRAERARIMEERRLEELRLKAEMLAKQAALKKAAKKNKNHQQQQQIVTESSKQKKKNKKNKTNGNVEERTEPESLEETIPAMVTIKRIIENNNCPPTVTITLKGSTPDQDKLLYTLVNGHNNPTNPNNKTAPDKKDAQKSSKKKKKDGGGGGVAEKTESVTTSELKVTLSVDKSFRKELENNKISIKKQKKKPQSQPQQTIVSSKSDISDRVKMKDNMIDIPSLKLPPGITITKVSGPLTNRKPNNVQSSDYPTVPANKSGVIVVDTEKLIQQSVGTKKTKKKKKKGQAAAQQEPAAANTEPASHPETTTPPLLNMNEQATISKGANGMVTIRRPRPVALTNEAPISDYLSPVIQSKQSPNNKKTDKSESKPVFTEERKVMKQPSPKRLDCPPNGARPDFNASRLSAQNILWGLPGIQITRVNKNSNTIQDTDSSDQMADVSIIRTGGFNLDKDDWPYESVFTPKDILEDDLDADERELEAFKRFCQQSVPPKHKEKVAHLNVKDIVLMKKNDVTYS